MGLGFAKKELSAVEQSTLNRRLFNAVQYPTVDVTLVRRLVREGADLHAVNDEGMSIAQFVIHKKSTAGLEVIAELGADLTAVGNEKITPLEMATRDNYELGKTTLERLLRK